ncbi:hypothetical protein CFP56_038728 [Quercus suber]|uniref:Uncharacterized protein n=1 Tax=Quercus suber TaxID=58331 RepID=A0AAW0J244_QUESU
MEQLANLLDCISWSGVGPGLMDAATKVALHSTQKKKKGCFTSGKTTGWRKKRENNVMNSYTNLGVGSCICILQGCDLVIVIICKH